MPVRIAGGNVLESRCFDHGWKIQLAGGLSQKRGFAAARFDHDEQTCLESQRQRDGGGATAGTEVYNRGVARQVSRGEERLEKESIDGSIRIRQRCEVDLAVPAREKLVVVHEGRRNVDRNLEADRARSRAQSLRSLLV